MAKHGRGATNMKIKCYIKPKEHFGICLPKKATAGASGFDLRAFLPENVYGEIFILPSHVVTIPTGLCFDIPQGYEIEIRGRSGLWFKHSVCIGQHGTIDSDYTGEVKIRLINHGREKYYIRNGDRIAQAVINKLPDVEIIEGTGDIKKTARGGGGFGSTGV
jgi:dUTP pyrophosphatase